MAKHALLTLLAGTALGCCVGWLLAPRPPAAPDYTYALSQIEGQLQRISTELWGSEPTSARPPTMDDLPRVEFEPWILREEFVRLAQSDAADARLTAQWVWPTNADFVILDAGQIGAVHGTIHRFLGRYLDDRKELETLALIQQKVNRYCPVMWSERRPCCSASVDSSRTFTMPLRSGENSVTIYGETYTRESVDIYWPAQPSNPYESEGAVSLWLGRAEAALPCEVRYEVYG